MKRTVVAMCPRYSEAEQAVHELLRREVNRDDISIVALHGREPDGTPAAGEAETATMAGAGAVVGGLAGAVLG